MSQFGFLEPDFGEVFDASVKAERFALDDPGTAMFHARRALEFAVKWAFVHDRGLPMPYEQTLNAFVNEPAFKAIQNGRVFDVAKKIQRAGNRAVHEAKPPSKLQSVEIIQALHMFAMWFGHTYGRTVKPDLAVRFDPNLLSSDAAVVASSLKERQQLEADLAAEEEAKEQARAALAAVEADRALLEAELAKLREEVAATKAAAEQTPIPEENWSEAETRAFIIDKLLAEAGWALDGENDKEFEVRGMPNPGGLGYVDYVLWGDDGLPLAVVEAKRTTVSVETGRQQAKLYADCLEEMFGRRPVVYLTNGYEHHFWDVGFSANRGVQGFHTKDELELLITRRTDTRPLHELDVDTSIVERYYQERAIRKIAESFEQGHRKGLLVMATGAGKTRTTIALIDLLMRANVVKRVLFLADRTALVEQAVGAFSAHLPAADPVNLVTERDAVGRVYVSTYQTMVGLIDDLEADGTRRFGVGHFDLVVIDEAHRSVYKKYRGIFEYFDSLLVGLTATPRDQIDKNTYDLFDLETGVPTDAYSLEEAINDGFLVPPEAYSVPLKFIREGIRYEELSDDEKEQWDELDWDDDGGEPPDEVNRNAINQWLFNADTVDKVLENLMTDGIKVAGGDRVGKTILFAKNQRHAEFIFERFNLHYPLLAASGFARVITNQTKYSHTLIKDFGQPNKDPHIAISVDMLDTGIDVPECVNLVFFKLVRSRTKFWQMIGRGTRLCPDLFGPGDNKTKFRVFDYCMNLEFFESEMNDAEGGLAPSLTEQLWFSRLELVHAMSRTGDYITARSELAELLRSEVASMNVDNFLVRPHLEKVTRFREPESWGTVSPTELAELRALGGLPRELDADHEDAKRFDVLILGAQLGVVDGADYGFQRKRIQTIASLLQEKDNIPQVAAQMELIIDIQSDEWWQDATYQMLESARKQLRLLVTLLDKTQRPVIYANFADEIGAATIVDVVPSADSFEQFRKKAEHFLRENLGESVIMKVRSGEPITQEDIEDLQRLLVAAGIGDTSTFETASQRAGNFGLFIRSIVGLDRAAAKAAFQGFLEEKKYSATQIGFVNLIIDELTSNGVLEVARLYDDPYTGLAPQGPEALFSESEIDALIEAIQLLNQTTA